ncbi:hypothetical protein [Brevibacillus sp. 1238]|uniref:hypothetical protein n=1 Tax=Brevibacillus sp. 1238 TaxID=2940565 RepID=UPI0024765070|nr:hypothetical protein [Brevibacillus sp. 1238]MDH6351941.1 hypothetical protein [Brevibacillus sp. 1238]
MATNTERIVLDPSAPDSLKAGAEKINRAFDIYDQKVENLEAGVQVAIGTASDLEFKFRFEIEPVLSAHTDDVTRIDARIDNVLGDQGQLTDAVNGLVASEIPELKTRMNNVENDTGVLYVKRTEKDINGVYTVVRSFRGNGTMHTKSELTLPDESGRYSRRTETRYAADGTTPVSVVTSALFYDEDGDLYEEKLGEY